MVGMSESNTMKQGANHAAGPAGGPAAPKDPTAKRSGFYVMLDTQIEATARAAGKPSQEIYLDGERLKTKATLDGGVTDENILSLLETCCGFHKLVHSIGVSVNSAAGPIDFILQTWGKTDRYEGGTIIRIPCPKDGLETVFKLEDFEWSEDDDVLGKFAFEFPRAGDMGTASVKFYLQDGYEVPELTTEAPVAFGSHEYQAMIQKSLVSRGNNQRLKDAISRAKGGLPVTIAYIGGSITQGAGAKPIHTNCYAYQSYLQFKTMFGKDGGENVRFVKAGVGGTPSELGMIRYDRDVLRDGAVEPDVVIVEFAVNDAGDETGGKCYESLCLKILSAKNKPAVVLLFSVFVNDWNLQDRLSPVGFHYDLPMVSVKDAVVDQFRLTKKDGNVISKRQFFYDTYHPTNDGHRVMADCLGFLWREMDKSNHDDADIHLAQRPIIGNEFTGVRLLDRKDNTGVATIDEGSFTGVDTELQMVEMDENPFGTPQFPHNWRKSSASGNQSFKMAISSRSLLLVFKDSGASEFGKADVFVDGKCVKTLDPHLNNWTHCNAVILYQEDVVREHQIEVRMSPDSESKSFTILGFGYTL